MKCVTVLCTRGTPTMCLCRVVLTDPTSTNMEAIAFDSFTRPSLPRNGALQRCKVGASSGAPTTRTQCRTVLDSTYVLLHPSSYSPLRTTLGPGQPLPLEKEPRDTWNPPPQKVKGMHRCLMLQYSTVQYSTWGALSQVPELAESRGDRSWRPRVGICALAFAFGHISVFSSLCVSLYVCP